MFRELFTEAVHKDLKRAIDKVIKNKAYKKNAASDGETLYFEIDDVKSALRLRKAIEEMSFVGDDLSEMGGGATNYISKNALGQDAKARIKMVFKNGVPEEVIKYTKARKI